MLLTLLIYQIREAGGRELRAVQLALIRSPGEYAASKPDILGPRGSEITST